MEFDTGSKTKVTCDVFVFRDGKLHTHIAPYETATTFEKFLYHIGLKNLTRSN